jgi:hypothetical protein
VSIGAVIGEGWSIYKRLWRRSIVVAGLIFLVVALADGLAAVSGTVATSTVSLALSLIGGLLVQGALVEVVRDLHESRPPERAAAYYQRTRDRLGTLLGAAILEGIGVAIGLLLLVVPGLIAVARWSLVVPLVVIERRGIRDAFARSSELVRGRTGRVLALLVVTNVIVIGAQLALRSLFTGLPLFWRSWLGGTVAGALVVPFAAYVLTALYYRLTEPGRPVLP